MEKLNFYQYFLHEAIPFGWKVAKKNVIFFLEIFAVMIFINIIPNLLRYIFGDTIAVENVGDIIVTILTTITGFGLIKIFLSFAKEESQKFNDLFSHDRTVFLQWIIGRFFTSVIVLLGLFLLIIPGVIVGSRLYFVDYFIIDKRMTAIDAIKASRAITKGHVRQIIGVAATSFGIWLLGVLVVGIGLLRAIPTSGIATARLYNKIKLDE